MWGYGFAHLIHMGMMQPTEECPHAQTSHELCKIVLDTQAVEKVMQKDVLSVLLLVIPLVAIAFLLVQYIQKMSEATENESPPLMQELFSRGILNPKVP